MNEKLELLKLLADATRLDILNLLLKEDSYVEKLACELSLTPATICYHLKKLEAAGVVNCSRAQFYMIYSLNRAIFDQPLYQLIRKEEHETDTEEKYRKEVIAVFFKYECERGDKIGVVAHSVDKVMLVSTRLIYVPKCLACEFFYYSVILFCF